MTDTAASPVRRAARDTLAPAIAPWLVSRAIVLAAIALAIQISREVGTRKLGFVSDGLFAWDAAYYRDIAVGAYGAVERAGLRFFPLLPMAGWVTGFGWKPNWGVVVVANAAALAATALVYRLVRDETGDDALARRAMWFFALFPAAAVTVLPYAESLLVTATVVAFIALRRHAWWGAVIAGFLAGLTRPTGALLVVPALVTLWRLRDRRRERPGALASAIAPVLGLASFLTYSLVTTGEFLRPVRLFSAKNLRGGWADPITRIARGFGDLFGDRVGSGLHVLWALFFLALLVVMARRLPAEYTWWSAATVVLALSGDNLDSFERYCFVVFPFMWVLALLADRDWRERVVLAGWASGLVGYTVLAVLGISVP